MKIKDPVANYGQAVRVVNYRSSYRPVEEGKVCALSYKSAFGEKLRWSYRVRLDRESRKGRPIYLYVGDEKIWPILETESRKGK
jgi:hypothetical protein